MRPGRIALLAGVAATLGCAAAPRRLAGTPAPAQWIAVAPAEAEGARNPHDHAGSLLCQRCHADHSPRLVEEDEVALCQRCHAFHHGNHPVRVAPRKSHPAADLPMRGGRVTCATCHDPHAVKAARAGLRKPFDALCTSCHFGH